MRNIWTLILLLLVLSGCSAPTAKFIDEQEMKPVSYIDIAPLKEVEDRLTRAFADQVDWDTYDRAMLIKSLGAIKAEFEWLEYEATNTGSLTYYEVLVAEKKIRKWWGDVQKELDAIVEDGQVDSDTSLIYYYVRRDIKANMLRWNLTIQAATAAIDSKIHRYDVDQIKDAYNSLKPFISTLL